MAPVRSLTSSTPTRGGEAFEIENEREEEIQELKTLYMDKGLTEGEAEMVVARVSENKERFLEDMLANELHIHKSHLEKPYKVGLVIGLSFLLGALVPLLPSILPPRRPHRWSLW